jgi:phosphatidylglycerophosphatase C
VAPGPALVLFDLDGTLTRHDTLLPFVAGLLRRYPGRALRLPSALPALLGYAAGRRDRGALKGQFIRATIGGLRRDAIADWTARYVPRLLARGLRADALATLEAHRRAGNTLVLLSASPDLYVPEVGAALGFRTTVCTAITWDRDRLIGSLASPNRRGAEKARCLVELRARYPGQPVVAYGNAASDLPHLALAERGVLVNGTHAAQRAAQSLGVECVRWR